MFTGDRSGDFLYAALHRAGFANQPSSDHADDGLELIDTWITAVVRCAPPANKPSTEERDTCFETFLVPELETMSPKVILTLGGFAWSAVHRFLRDVAPEVRRPSFGHGASVQLGEVTVLASYHPSQQNTFTGRLTPEMLDAVLGSVREALGA